jgi:site-specific DNA-cytosine methylase
MKFKNKETGEVVDFSPCLINSALLSAQNRQRYYWANWDFEAPEDKGLVISDIKQDSAKDKYYLSEKLLAGFARKRERRKHMKSGFDKLNVRLDSEKVSCLTARYFKMSMSDPYLDQGGIRKLTPTECERAQTVPDNYTNHVSNTQRYKMLGNGWTVDVVAHIFKSLTQHK